MYKKVFESDYGSENYHVTRRNNEIEIRLTYPNVPHEHGNVMYVLVNQESVRASDGVRLHYDYQRDGFVIEQAQVFEWDASDRICDPKWKEVAFIESWALETPAENE